MDYMKVLFTTTILQVVLCQFRPKWNYNSTASDGIQLESDGSNIYLNTGSTSNKVFINGDLDLASGGYKSMVQNNIFTISGYKCKRTFICWYWYPYNVPTEKFLHLSYTKVFSNCNCNRNCQQFMEYLLMVLQTQTYK